MAIIIAPAAANRLYVGYRCSYDIASLCLKYCDLKSQRTVAILATITAEVAAGVGSL